MLAPRRSSLGGIIAEAEQDATEGARWAASRAYEEVDVWNDIGSPGTSWEPGWGPGAPASYGPPQFLLDPIGVVHMRGVVARTSGFANTMFKLPYALRPAGTQPFWVWTDGGVGITYVADNGVDTIAYNLSPLSAAGSLHRYLSPLRWPRAL